MRIPRFLRMSKNDIAFLGILFVLTAFAMTPLLHKGLIATDDGSWMVIRFSAFYEDLRSGQIPVRFLTRLNHGYGYPAANFLYPGFMYAAAPLHAIGLSYITTIKTLLFFSIVLSGLFTYFWLSSAFSRLASFVGAAVFVYTPYHMYDVYKRGSVGEVFALAIIPFVLWQLDRRNVVLASVGTGLLILSHNILAVMFFGFLLVREGWMVLFEKNDFKSSFLPLLWGLVLSGFFWIPAVFELQYTRFLQTTISQWQNYFADISLIGLIGWPVLFLFAGGIVSCFLQRKDKNRRSYPFVLTIGLLALFLSVEMSSFLWEILPVSFVQFPFRFLSLVILIAAFAAAVLVDYFSGIRKLVLVVIIILASFYTSYPYISAVSYESYEDGFYSTNQATTTVKNEYMPVWVKKDPDSMAKEKVTALKSGSKIENLVVRKHTITFTAEVKQDDVIQINTLYFPGWNALVNGERKNINYDNTYGVMQLELPKGKHDVVARFTETPLRLMSNSISVVGFFLLFVYGIVEGKKHAKKHS